MPVTVPALAAAPLVAIPDPSAVEFARPALLAGIPVAAVALGLLVFYRRDSGSEGARFRAGIFTTRLLVLACLVVAAAGPYAVTTTESAGDSQVTMLVDESASMGVYEPVADDLEAAIEEQGVAVTRATVAAGDRSPVGDALLANLRANGSVLVVSDGRVTDGASLDRAADLARETNATVNRVALDRNRSESAVSLLGPAKASVGVEQRFAVEVSGVGGPPTGASVTVAVDGQQVVSRQVPANGTVAFARNFSETGSHRITARLASDDAYEANDVARKTVRVVEQPRVLYVARGEYPLESYLRQLYDVTRAETVPADLSPYYAVVVQDVAAPDLGNASTLQRAVIGGTGLVVVGGEHAFDRGGYENSPIASALPVTMGGSTGERSRVVLAVDVSGSARSGMAVQKSLALDALSQLGDRNEVGVVAFNDRAFRVAALSSLGDSRAELEDAIRRLTGGGGTNVGQGLLGAKELLGDRGGTVVLLSDGRGSRSRSFEAAERLADDDVRVITVGVGSVDGALMEGVAERTGGSFILADETDRLRILFGGPDRQFSGDGLTVVDEGHFVTRGVRPTAALSGANEVSVKDGARHLVATGFGTPAVSAWRFGLGRVVAVTAYGPDGGLDGLLSGPDSLLVSRSVNWAVGDPQRKATGVVAAPDTRVGEPTTVVYAGDSRPEAGSPSFSQVAPGRYEARLTPTSPGFRSVLDAAVAVDYRQEYASFGVAPALDRAVEQTGGETFEASEPAAIAAAVTRQTTHRQRVEREFDRPVLLAGLLLFVGEVCARRVRRIRGREDSTGGSTT